MEANHQHSILARYTSILERHTFGPEWTVVQDDPHIDFERELFRADDPETTSVNLRITLNTEAGTAQLVMSQQNDTGKELPILLQAPLPWATALQMLGATPNPGVAVAEPFTVIGFIRDTGKLFHQHVMAADGLNAFAHAADSEGLEMIAAIAGHVSEENQLCFPGESVVDSETIRD